MRKIGTDCTGIETLVKNVDVILTTLVAIKKI